MQTERWISTWRRPGPRRPLEPRARFSVTVSQDNAKPLRVALLERLGARVERLVSVPSIDGMHDAVATLHVVLARDYVDEALHIVMSTASSAQLGRVHRL